MASIDPSWIAELLFDKNKYGMNDTFTTFVHTASNYKNTKYKGNESKIVVHKGGHYLKESPVWEQIEKQFSAIEHYLGIKVEYFENKKSKYWRLIIDVRELNKIPDFMRLVKVNENGYVIKVENARRYIKAWNRVLKEYLYWCLHEHKNAHTELILPNIKSKDNNKFYGFKFSDSQLDKKEYTS